MKLNQNNGVVFIVDDDLANCVLIKKPRWHVM
jgi:hypothetical protein